MFKKTITELKELKEIEVTATVKIDAESTKQVCKTVVKTVAVLSVMSIAHTAACALVDSISSSKKSND